MASVAQILKSRKSIPTAFGRLTTEGVYSPREKLIRILGGLKTDISGKQKLESVSEDDLMDLPIEDLVLKMVKSDPLIDLTVDLFCTLVSLEHQLTSESSRGERALSEILGMLETKKIPLSLLVSHICASMILRGNVCVERVFDDKGRPSSVFSLDPRWFKWELKDKGPPDGQMWYLGQNTGAKNAWEELDSPNILWLSINPLVGERTGRSPLATAFPSLIGDSQLLDSMTKVIKTQAFVRRYIQFKVLEAKEAGYSDTQIAQMVKEAEADMSAWRNLNPQDIPTSTDMISWNQEPGAQAGTGFDFTNTADRIYDRKSIRGAKLPVFVAGSNEFVAESSANTQAKFYSVQLGGGQENLKFTVEWVFRGFFRSMGVRSDPIFTTKRVNVVERLEEARAFEAMVKGLQVAVETGMSLPTALKLYESETGMTLSAEIVQRVTEEFEKAQREGADNVDDVEPSSS